MPRLQAEASLRLMSDLAAGTGVMEEEAQRSYRRDLLRAQNDGRRPKAQKASAASLEAMGFTVITKS
jgi:hypothetical protein